MRGTIPPGGAVPLHSLPDPETFVPLSGEAEGPAESDGTLGWVRIEPGEVFHVPACARHAFRNRAQQPAVALVAGTAWLGRFFREVGTSLAPGAPPPGPPSAASVRRFLTAAARYGHRIATPEENARLGLSLPPVA